MVTRAKSANLEASEATLCILASLAAAPKHGYAISKDVEKRSAGTVRLAIGNLYVVLRRLLEQGLIEHVGEKQEGGTRRKVYRITSLGQRMLDHEYTRLASILQVLYPFSRPALALTEEAGMSKQIQGLVTLLKETLHPRANRRPEIVASTLEELAELEKRARNEEWPSTDASRYKDYLYGAAGLTDST